MVHNAVNKYANDEENIFDFEIKHWSSRDILDFVFYLLLLFMIKAKHKLIFYTNFTN